MDMWDVGCMELRRMRGRAPVSMFQSCGLHRGKTDEPSKMENGQEGR